MKRCYYLYESCYNSQGELVYFGVKNKIDMMLREFSNYFEIHEVVIDRNMDFFHKLLARLPFASNGYNYKKSYLEIEKPDYIYIRKPIIDSQFLEFVKIIKKRYPQCKILLEVFTYPYDQEYRLKRTYPLLIKERKNRKKLHLYIDRVLTFGKYDEIFHIKTIITRNGIDFNGIPLPAYKKSFNPDNFTIISVATMQPAHGYERIIKGLHDYYLSGGTARIIYKVVGNGSELEYYKSLVENYKLMENVIFVGPKSGEELTREFDDADIAVEVLGGYKDRKKRGDKFLSSSLKSREYFARGIPFITASDMDLDEIEDLRKYYMHVDEESNTVDMRSVIQFLSDLFGNENRVEFAERMREEGKKYLDYSVTCKPIINYFNQ